MVLIKRQNMSYMVDQIMVDKIGIHVIIPRAREAYVAKGTLQM